MTAGQHGYASRSGWNPRRVLRRLILFALVVYAGLFAWTGYLLGQAESAFRAGRLDEAAALLERAALWRVRTARVADGRGVVALALGSRDAAGTYLASARGGWFFRTPAFGESAVLERFLRDGGYEAAALYADHRMRVSPTPSLSFHLGAASLALDRLDDAEKHLSWAASDAGWSARAAPLLALAKQRRSSGRPDVLFDAHQRPIAAHRAGSDAWHFPEPSHEPLLKDPVVARLAPPDAAGRVDLTFDLDIDRAARAALGDQRGSLVVLDSRTGALLAAVSSPAGEAPPAALGRTYEPGSIVKMITLSAALRKGIDLEKRFPMNCPGVILIEGVPFRDWTTHSGVESIDEAVAVSCNIVFGRLGLDVGRRSLDEEFRMWGFAPEGGDSALPGDIAGRTGRLLEVNEGPHEYGVARRAEGLDSIEITPIHAAMIAAGLARGGSVPLPWVIARRTNILGEIEVASGGDMIAGPLPEPLAMQLRRGMVRAAIDPRGTGRRAAIEGFTMALKTGTSGENPPGLDALVIGFAPAESPRIAWGLVAEGAGKAEIVGARITRDFLSRMRSYLQ